MPELRFAITQQPLRSLSQAATEIWTIDLGISYTGSIGWRITDPSVLSNTESTLLWMDDKASSLCLKKGDTHRSRHSKSMDNTSLNHSDIFILMIGTYRSLFKYLVRFTTQRILGFSTAHASRPGRVRDQYSDTMNIQTPVRASIYGYQLETPPVDNLAIWIPWDRNYAFYTVWQTLVSGSMRKIAENVQNTETQQIPHTTN